MNKWILLGLLPSIVQAAEPVVIRSSGEPQEAWQGQRVMLTIEVLSKDAWAQIPNMPSIQVAGAYVLPPESQGGRIQEQIDGHPYSGQRYQLLVYPQRGGIIEIPALPVAVKRSVWGAANNSENQGLAQVTIPKVTFTSKVPPGAEGIDWLVSTDSFSATQSWSGEQTELKVGDAIKRSVSLKATNVSGMAFKPIVYPRINGLGIYPSQPTVKDTRDRGSLRGNRQEEVTYIFESAGVVEVPALEFVWWDLKNKKLKKIVLAGRKVTIIGGSTASTSDDASSTIISVYTWWCLLGAVVLAGLGTWKREAISVKYLARKAEHSDHANVYFKRFAEAASLGDTLEAQSLLMKWLDRVNTSNSPARLDSFLACYADYSCDMVTLLNSPVELLNVVTLARKNWSKSKVVEADSILPRLN